MNQELIQGIAMLVIGAVGLILIAWLLRPRRPADPQPEQWMLGNREDGTGERMEQLPVDGNHLLCPDCHQPSLLAGPSGGAAQNVACESCHSEFNIGTFASPPVIIQRMGKLTMGRAQIYGISPEEFAGRRKTA